jgi:hypothetical protein
MNIFFVLVLEVDYGVVADLADEGVVMDGALVENFSDKRYINSYKGSILREECRE